MNKEDLSPEDQAYYKRLEFKPSRVLLYLLAVVYLVFVYAVGGSSLAEAFSAVQLGTLF
ncbi:hypothetical protein [Marinobacter sp.]|uniref:hypothetical protein n=1 Tax=Marinobacter sp. TaxID=50741 RepID=UPI0034A2AB4E